MIEEDNSKIMQSTDIFESIMPGLSRNLPTEAYDFEPVPPQKKYFVPTLSTRMLTRRIYIEMLKAIRSYGMLEEIAPVEDKTAITNLKNQMEILSLAMLNIYGKISDRNKVPFFVSGGTNLSKDYNKALFEMYDKVWHIHNLVFRLIAKNTNEQIRSTLVIVYTNLKSQLKTLQQLR